MSMRPPGTASRLTTGMVNEKILREIISFLNYNFEIESSNVKRR